MVGGLVALGLVGLAVFAVVLILVARRRPDGPGRLRRGVRGRRRTGQDSRRARRGYDRPCRRHPGRDAADGHAGRASQTPCARPAQDPSVAAVVLEVNSPGGGVTASDEMHQSILDFKKNTGKPVVVSMGDVGGLGRLLHLDRGRPHSRQRDDPDGLIRRHLPAQQLRRGR